MTKKIPSILVINGANLNLLGKREPEKYGTQTLEDLQNNLEKQFKNLAVIDFFQSNHEGDIIDIIQTSKTDAMVLNLGAYTHTSIAIADSLTFALKNNGVKCAAEVHISNIHAREPFRKLSYISNIVDCVICGCGTTGYQYAIDFCITNCIKNI